MSITFKNRVVFIDSQDGTVFQIYDRKDKEMQNCIGEVKLLEDDTAVAGIYVEVLEPYRGMHYASNAVYLLTLYAHEQKQIDKIKVVLNPEQEMALHILEHAGYQRDFQSQRIIYTHDAAETVDATSYQPPEGTKLLYLAGGCFWGTQKAFQVLRGVVDTEVGYANGHVDHPTYEMICRNETGFRETVRVTYDPRVLSMETLLEAYFIVTDPTKENQQGGDIGSQYQSGIYWRDAEDEARVKAYLEQEKEKYPAFHVEAKALESFYLAEEYHQDYLVKNTNGYCHVTVLDLEKIKALNA